ncbi:hypothetical protein C1I97_28640 [Streptomyces sp. NTH33]|uniref:hypothetical protein n=1 Tax=Streptomyces sp. NTH33 TaxID=1735453 RepID=UPI000DA75355|nr:hypothetical protein [Streptomyces sp. NTH33]PZG93490.1 hypothetical protein C1I97_28640 [Streptomyces sp. NTH33]
MTPTETVRLVGPVAATCPSAHLEETTAQARYLLLADLDATDAWTAVIRLGRQRHHIAADILAEVRAVRGERLARAPLPLPDTDPDAPRRYRAELLASVNAITSSASTRRPSPRPIRLPSRRPEARRRLEARPAHPLPSRALPLVQGPLPAAPASSPGSAFR